MKHPVNGPRVYAMLLMAVAALISWKFFGRSPQASSGSASRTVDTRAAHSGALAGEIQLSSATRDHVDSLGELPSYPQTGHRTLPNWLAQSSELDSLIQTGARRQFDPPLDVELEPLQPWTTGRRGDRSEHLLKGTRPTDSVPPKMSAGSLTSGEIAALEPEAIVPRAVDEPTDQQPRSWSDQGTELSPYRSSPWEISTDESHSQVAGQAPGKRLRRGTSSSVASSSAWSRASNSKRIRWPDEQLSQEQLARVGSLDRNRYLAPSDPGRAAGANLAGSIQRLPSSSGSEPEERTSVVPRVGDPNRFVFQPGFGPE